MSEAEKERAAFTEWSVDGEITPEMAEKASMELNLAVVQMICESMHRDFERRYPIEARKDHPDADA